MSEILVAALSPTGHIEPLLAVAEDLICRGDRVTVMTGPAHTEVIRTIGAHAHPLPPEADFGYSTFDAAQRGAHTGIDEAIIRLFIRPMRAQAATLRGALAERRYDAIIVDYGFFGILPLLLGGDGKGDRDLPPVLYYTPTPLLLSSRDTAPTGMGLPPATTVAGRLLHRGMTVFSQKVLLRKAQRAADRELTALGARRLPVPLLDVGVLADRLIVPTVPELEYPRTDLPAGVRFVGVVRPRPVEGFVPPRWWGLLDGDRPVVHVTQGTVDNVDLTRLIEPTIAALAGSDAIVVVSTGGAPVDTITVPIPANTFVAEYLPHDQLLPKVDILVTNGGYGAVQRALSAGVPIIVAGSTEDKPEVAARVAWSGAGINLRTGTPTPAAVAAAYHRIRTDGRYLRNARRLEAAFAQRDGVAEICVIVDEVIGPMTSRRVGTRSGPDPGTYAPARGGR